MGAFQDGTSDERGTPVTRALGAATEFLGSFPAVCGALIVILTWAVGGLFIPKHWLNDTYQLVVNTLTTIVTFIMVFVIQNTQNRDGRALQVKLDAILTNQREQAQAVNAVLDKVYDGEPPDHACILFSDELMGLEEAPAKEIKAEQQRVRDA